MKVIILSYTLNLGKALFLLNITFTLQVTPPVGQSSSLWRLLVLPALSAARHGELRGRPGAAPHPLGLHHLGHLGQPRLRPRVPVLVLHEAVVDVALGALKISQM